MQELGFSIAGMWRWIAVLSLSLCATFSFGQSVSCTQISLYIICDNGVSASRVGNYIYFGDGTTANVIGNVTSFSDGTTATQVGTFTYYAGTVTGTASQVGNVTYYDLNLSQSQNPASQSVAIANYQEQRAQYAAGYAIGQKIGMALFNRKSNMNKFCKKHPALLISGKLYGPYNVCTLDGKPIQ